MFPKKRRSLYPLLGGIIAAVVMAVLSVQAGVAYFMEREHIAAELENDAAATIVSLQKNLAPLMAAYAVNDYDMLTATELSLHPHAAVIITDHHMGKVFGDSEYSSGWLRNERGELEAFDPQNAQQRAQLEKSAGIRSASITTATGEPLGVISVYLSDAAARGQLSESLRNSIARAALVAVVLIACLLLALRRYLFEPLGRIAAEITRVDADGLPAAPLPDFHISEIALLTDTINSGLTTSRQGQQSLQAERDRLKYVLEGTNVGTWEWTIPTGATVFNERWAEIVGHTLQELAPINIRTWLRMAHPDDLAHSQALLNALFAGKTPFDTGELRTCHHDGRGVWCRDRV